MPRVFEWVDVFTTKPGGGNPLPVVLDAEGLSPAQMQAIAREFNTAETTFVLAPADPHHTARVRIFTPVQELPFAGHPNIGTAYVLARRGTVFGQTVGDTLVFEERAGLVPLQIMREDGVVVGASFTAPEPFKHGTALSVVLVATALGIDASEIDPGLHPPLMGSVGLPFVLVALHRRAALAALDPDRAGLAALFAAAGVTGVLAYAQAGEADADATWSARMFCLHPAVTEDPATGSANAALVALRATLAGTVQSYTIAQGVEMGRPSLLEAWTDAEGRAYIGGRCAPVLVGQLNS